MDRSRPVLFFRVAAAFVLLGCSAPRRPVPSAKAASGATGALVPGAAPASAHDPNTERYTWEAATHSPRPLDTEPDGATPCGASDHALRRVAERLAAREAAGKPMLDTSEITFALRSAGSPYVWPRAWTLQGEHDAETEQKKVAQWLESIGGEGDERCAVASRKAPDGRTAFAAVAVTALADLEPFPTRVSVGTWLDFRAVLLVPATRVEVVVLGPRGRPHAVLASFSGSRVRARLRADNAGTWLVQLVATTESGPRLAAEALVAAGTDPPETFDAGKAPGEEVARPHDAPNALLAMLNGARASEGLSHVRRDARLDGLARAQAEAMLKARSLSHDVSGESMAERVSALALRSAGENVAHATNVARAHRSLWRSPSHRETLLHPAFELVGIGVASDEDGTVWVCELFADPN